MLFISLVGHVAGNPEGDAVALALELVLVLDSVVTKTAATSRSPG
jgi:hypothetical protein